MIKPMANLTRMQFEKLSFSDYYKNASCCSWLDFFASVIYNERYIVQIIKTKPSSVLEVGAARGVHSIALSYIVPKVIGLDIDRNLIKIATHLNLKFGGKAMFSRMDAFRMGFDDNSFSVCCSQGFFEHFSDSEVTALLDEQLRVAQKVIFSVPSCYYPTRNIGNERLMSLHDWKRIMNRYIVDGFYYGPNIDTSIGLLSSMKPNAIKRMLTTKRKAQICFTVNKK